MEQVREEREIKEFANPLWAVLDWFLRRKSRENLEPTGEPLSPLRNSRYALSKISFAKALARLFSRFRTFFFPSRKRLGGRTRGSTRIHRVLIYVSATYCRTRSNNWIRLLGGSRSVEVDAGVPCGFSGGSTDLVRNSLRFNLTLEYPIGDVQMTGRNYEYTV